jgi:hypothetical protein
MPGAASGSARSAPVLAAVEAGLPNRSRQNKNLDRILARLISGCVLDESRCVFVPTRAKFAYRMICLLRVQTPRALAYRLGSAGRLPLPEFNPLLRALAGVKWGRCLLAGARPFTKLILTRLSPLVNSQSVAEPYAI